MQRTGGAPRAARAFALEIDALEEQSVIHSDEIRRLIAAAIPNAEVTVRDTTGGGDHFEAVVVSDAFAGKALIEQHQMVYATLREAMAERIHALSLKTYTPDQWQRAARPLRVVS